MSKVSFENFGKLADTLRDYTMMSGRYSVQEKDKKKIIGDIIKKLDLNPEDSVLEIGCGVGDLLIPVSFLVDEITGIDHESCIERLRKRFCDNKNMRLIPGNFLDLSLKKRYNKILCYSVLQYLENKKEVIKFIDKAVNMLNPGGKVFFGDIPNRSTKERFLNSRQGKEFSKKWNNLIRKVKDGHERKVILPVDEKLVRFDDTLVLDILSTFRQKGYHTYIFSQPPGLPFGNSREDILIEKLS